MYSRLLLQPACQQRFRCPRAWFRKHISHRTASPDTHPPYLSPSSRWTQGSSVIGREDPSELSNGPNSPVANFQGSQPSSPVYGGLSPSQDYDGPGGFAIEHAPAYSRSMEGSYVPPNSGIPHVQGQYRPYRPGQAPV